MFTLLQQSIIGAKLMNNRLKNQQLILFYKI